MKISDIIRQFADHIDQQEHGEPENSMPHAELHSVGDVAMPDHTDPTIMIPPLQQKLELLKKAAGEPNAFDDGVGGEEKQHDELDDLRRIAGLTVMIDGEHVQAITNES